MITNFFYPVKIDAIEHRKNYIKLQMEKKEKKSTKK